MKSIRLYGVYVALTMLFPFSIFWFFGWVTFADSVAVWVTSLRWIPDAAGAPPPWRLTIDDVDDAGTLMLDIDKSLVTYHQPKKTLVQVHSSPPEEEVIEEEAAEILVVDLIDKKDDFIFEVTDIAWTSDDVCLFRLVDLDALDNSNSFLVDSDYSIDRSVDGKSFVLRTKIRNLWTIDEHITLNASMRDYFWIAYRSMPIEFTLPTHDELNLTIPMWDIPRYKMWFTVTLNVASSPANPLENELSGDLLRSKSISHLDTFFLFPRWLVWVILGVLIVLNIVRKLSKKYHHTEWSKQNQKYKH